MKSTIVRFAIAAALGIGLAQADDLESSRHSSKDYRVVTLADLDGPTNSGNSINNEGLVAGFADLEDGTRRHAMLWFHGFPFELDTLGGPNSNVQWPVKNQIGLIAGIAQTNIPEPLGQTWSCRAFFPATTSRGLICLGVVWENGRIRALPTLGGHNGFATGANDLRQVVGWAQNTVLDSSCNPLHVKQQFRAVMWGPRENQMQQLLPLQGDSTSAATAINNRSQVVGISGDCGTAVGGTSAREGVLWEKGRVEIIGNLGGIAWNTPMAINERGEVVGFSNISAASGAAPNWHAFYWRKGAGIKDLKALDGFPLSQALGINNKGQIVGTSCTADFVTCRAVLWENGRMIDLNDRVPGYADELAAANDINDDGEIAGQAFAPGSERFVAVQLIPLKRRHGHADDDERGSARSSRVAAPLPHAMREALLQRYGLTDAK
jgi:probable HAF family extracellular repeat protein